jgi:hypothetical protein
MTLDELAARGCRDATILPGEGLHAAPREPEGDLSVAVTAATAWLDNDAEPYDEDALAYEPQA